MRNLCLCCKHLLIVNNDVWLCPNGLRCQLCVFWPYTLLLVEQNLVRRTKALNVTIICWKILLFFLIFGPILWILLYSDSTMSTFKLFLIYILTACSHSTLDSFFFTSKPLYLRDSRRPYCSRFSILLDFNSSWDSRYASFPSKLVISLFNFSMDASLAFSFSSNVDIFQ